MINNFGLDGIGLLSGNNTIIGNWIGLGPDGVTANGNGGAGISVSSSPGNRIGGATLTVGIASQPQQSLLARNVIAGNAGRLRIQGAAATNNLITLNYIGTNAAGSAAVPNLGNGVHVVDSPANQIGGNVVSGNVGEGVRIDGPLRPATSSPATSSARRQPATSRLVMGPAVSSSAARPAIP